MQHRKDKRLISEVAILLLVLIALNVIVISVFDREVTRYCRLVSAIVFVIFVFVNSVRGKNLILYISVVILLRQISLFYYESPLGYMCYFIFGITGYLLICWERIHIIRLIKFNLPYTLLAIVVLTGNFLAFYIVSKNIDAVSEEEFIPLFFCAYGMFLIVTFIIAFLYNVYFNSNKSLLFIYLIMAFALADLSSLLEYYMGYFVFSYVEIVLYLGAFGLYVIFTFNEKIEMEEKEQLKLLEIPE